MLWPLPILLLAVLVLCVRLAAGPVDVPVPARALDALMDRAAPGWRLQTSGAEFDLFGTDGLTGLKLRDITITNPQGNDVAAMPELGLSMALSLSDQTNEIVAIRAVRLQGANLDITRNAEGQFSLGVDGFAAPDETAIPLSLADLLGGDTASKTPIPRIELLESRVGYHDIARNMTMTARASSAVFDPLQQKMRVQGHVETGAGQAMAFDINAARLAQGQVALEAAFADIVPKTFAAFDPALAPLSALDMALAGSLRATLADDLSLVTASATLKAPSGGAVTIDGQARHIERLALDLTYAPDELRVEITDLAIAQNGLTLAATGRLHQTGPDGWSLVASAPGITYDDPQAAISLSTGPTTLAARLENGQVTVREFKAMAPVLRLPRDKITATSTALTLAGALDRDSGSLDLTKIIATGINAEADGTRIQTTNLTASLSRAGPQVMVHSMVLSGITARHDDTALALSGAKGSARLDTGTGRITVDTIALSDLRAALPEGREITAARLSASGAVDTRAGTLSLTHLRAPGIAASLPRLYDTALTVKDLDTALDITGKSLDIRNLAARVGGLAVGGRATLSRSGDGQRVKMAMTAGKTDFGTVVALWPKGVAPGGKRWVSRNILAGKVSDFSLEAQFDTANPGKDTLALTFDFDDAAVRAIRGMPPLQNGRGRGQVSLDRLDVFLAGGQVDVPGATRFDLTESRFSIADFGPRVPVGRIALNVDGPVKSVLGFLDHEPLALISRSGFDIAGASGDVSGKVQVKLPLKADLDIEEVDFRAAATVHEFSLAEPHTGVTITGSSMNVAVAPDGLKFRADARADGLSARMEYAQGFSKPAQGEPEGVLTLKSYLTREDFADRLGVDVSAYFDGVAVLDAQVDLYPGGGARYTANADLTGSSLRIAPLGWVKTPDVPVTVALSGFRNPDGAGQIDKIALRGTGISANGRIAFDTSNTVRLASFDRIMLADLLDIGLVYHAPTPQAPRRIDLTGGYLDLRRSFADAMDASQEQTRTTRSRQNGLTDITARLAKIRLRDDLAITGLDAGLRLVGSRVANARLAGNLNGIAPATLVAARRNDGLGIRLTSQDAGAFLAAASVFEGAEGGNLRLDLHSRDTMHPAQVSGIARADGITIRNSQTMRQMLSGGALGSLARQMLAGGLSFTKVEVPFSGIGGRWSIADGVAWGNALGLTLAGTYDIERKGIDLRGTLSPAYAINGALGSVPLLGGLLTGGEGEGMFGITYAVSGTTEAPNVWVNPLSAIAPGFLRKIVSGVMDGQNVATAAPRRPMTLQEADR